MAVERIQLRRGTTAEWQSANPKLSFGEPGVEITTTSEIKLKIGDGDSFWNDLPYFSPEQEIDLSAYYTSTQTNTAISTAIANLVNSAPSDLDTLNELAAALADDSSFATTILGEISSKADAEHTHTKSEITDFAHTHTISDVTDLQTSLDAKQEEITGAATSITSSDLTASRAIVSDSSGKVSASSVTSTELGYLSGVTSSIQTQLNQIPAGTEVTLSTATTYSLSANDVSDIVSISSASPITFTVNNVFTPGQDVTVYKKGDGIITFTAGSGVTLEGAGVTGVNLKLTNKFGAVNIFCERAGVYAIIGDVEIA